jgi:hypothetical protein
MSDRDDDYVAKIFMLLTSRPTSRELDELIEAHTRIGYLAAKAEQVAEMAKAQRDLAEARAFIEAKKTQDKRISVEEAKAVADVNTWPERRAEVDAIGKSRKLRNLWSSVEEAINGVKFLGRAPVGGVTFKGNP